jgi:hypothetical protein
MSSNMQFQISLNSHALCNQIGTMLRYWYVIRNDVVL